MPAATTTEGELCSLALTYAGQGQTIDSLAGASKEAKACSRLYAKRRDALLESFPWAFARKQVALALSVDDPPTGWTYAYELPADCLAAREIFPGIRNPLDTEEIPFETAGSLLFTDWPSAELIYTRQVTTVGSFAPLFVEALAWDLAVRLSLSLSIKPAVAQAFRQEAMFALANAQAAQLRHKKEDRTRSKYVKVRG